MANREGGTFAFNQMEKHGWKKGDGLGRTGNGIKDAIKVKVKNNKGGLGHNYGDEFTFHWWDHVFNKAANSIKVTSDTDGVKLEKQEGVKIDKSQYISTKKPLKGSLKGKPLLYGTFVKSGTYHAEESKEVIPSDSDCSTDSEENEEDFSQADMLQKTFEKTGLTGHKAARHGHKLSGKLKRIQDQEGIQPTTDKNQIKNKKRKRKNSSAVVTEEEIIKSDTLRKKKKTKNLSEEEMMMIDNDVATIKKKKKKKKSEK